MTNEVLVENAPQQKKKGGRFQNIFRSLVLVLLVILVLITGANAYENYITTKYNYGLESLRAENCLSAIQSSNFSDIFSEYQKDAYNNPKVETIYQQILISNEYHIMAIAAQTAILSACLH